MKPKRHPIASTTPAMRRAIQASTESLVKLAERYGINEKTVAKWRKRTTTRDAPMGPPLGALTMLSPEEQAQAVAFRLRTRLPLNDCLGALQKTIPHLSRSTLHRLFQRNGINRLEALDAAAVIAELPGQHVAGSGEESERQKPK